MHFKCCKTEKNFPLPEFSKSLFDDEQTKQRGTACSSERCISLMVHHGIRDDFT